MPGTTPNRGYPYPVNGDSPFDMPQAMQDLAEAFDVDMQNLSDSILRRPACKVSNRLADPQTFHGDVIAECSFNFVELDSDSISDLVNFPTRLTPTSAGLWMAVGQIVLGTQQSGARDLYVAANGVALDRQNFHSGGLTGSTQITVGSMSFMDGVDDYFTLLFEADRALEDFFVSQKSFACFRLNNV